MTRYTARHDTCTARDSVLFILVGMCTLTAQTFDSDPQNPANWSISTQLDGQNQFVRKEIEVIGGQSSTVVTTYVSPRGGGWTRNGIATSSAPPRPFPQAIQEHDVVTGSSAGSSTLRLEWISPFPVPADVRIWVRTAAWYHHNGATGNGSCSDGLGGTTQVNSEGGISLGFTLTTVSVSSTGLATFAVTQQAEAWQPSIYFGGAMIGGGAVDCGTSLMGGVDARVVSITINGGEAWTADYSQTTTSNAGITYSQIQDLWTGTYHTTAGNSQFDYAVPTRKRATVSYSANSNLASWTLGVPVLFQEKKDEPWPWGITYTPSTVPAAQFLFGGSASTQLSGSEWYSWNEGPAESGYNIAPFAMSRPSPFVRDVKLYQPIGVLTARLPEDHPTSPTTATLRLDYGWGDGAQASSVRHITFRDQFKAIHTLPQLVDDNTDGDPRAFIPYQDKSVSQVTVTFYHPTFQYIAVSTLFDIANLMGSYGQLDSSFASAFSVASFKNYVLGLFPDPTSSNSVYKNSTVFGGEKWAEWELVDGAWVRSLTPPAGQTLASYDWMVFARPKLLVTPKVVEEWHPDGFSKVPVQIVNVEQRLDESPRLYRFFYTGPPTGGDSSGGSEGNPGGS